MTTSVAVVMACLLCCLVLVLATPIRSSLIGGHTTPSVSSSGLAKPKRMSLSSFMAVNKVDIAAAGSGAQTAGNTGTALWISSASKALQACLTWRSSQVLDVSYGSKALMPGESSSAAATPRYDFMMRQLLQLQPAAKRDSRRSNRNTVSVKVRLLYVFTDTDICQLLPLSVVCQFNRLCQLFLGSFGSLADAPKGC